VGTLVIIAPITSWLLFGDRPGRASWCAVAVASTGLALLSLRGNGFGPGEAITLAAAAVWALHLVLLARWARPEHTLQLARIQTGTVAVLALVTVAVGGSLTGGSVLPAIPQNSETWLTVVFLAVLATAVAMILLSWAQSRLTATRAAVILTLEPAAAGITGALLGSEFGGRTIAGGALLVLAMLLVEVGSARRFGSQSARHRARPTTRLPRPLVRRPSKCG
jgi:drug/metabolite transporter (DMT)-like permease